MKIPLLLSRQARIAPAERPIVPVGKNLAMETGVYGLRTAKTWAGKTAGPGKTFLILDFRAKGRFTFEVDATAFDPKAKPGEKRKVVAFSDWADAWEMIHLVVDGEYGYGPRPESRFPKNPRFLPDVSTGGDLIFEIPANHRSLELLCDVPNLRLVSGEVVHPGVIRMPLSGKKPEPLKRTLIAKHQGSTFGVEVVGRKVSQVFRGTKASGQKKFLILDITVTNRGTANLPVQERKRFHYYTEKERSIGYSPVTRRSIHPPARPVWIPAGEKRTFQLVFEIPQSDQKLRLHYSGVKAGKIIELRKPCPSCGHGVSPEDRFCDKCGKKLKP